MFTTVVRIFFLTLLFTAFGMGLGLFLGIAGMVAYSLLHGGQVDMRNAYRDMAIPVAMVCGLVAFLGCLYLEFRGKLDRTSR